jgi:hypothetical protein
VDRCALFVDASYALADGAMAVHGTRRRDSVSWDHAGLLKLLAGLARDRTGLPVLRCYWYETAAEGRRTAEHDALAEMPGLKLRLVNALPGRREGIESQLRRDLVTLAKSGAISDAFIASANEQIAEIVAEVQDLGLRVVILHIASDGGWTIPVPLRQECDDIVEISGVHLRSYVDLIKGAEPVSADERYTAGQSGALTHQGLPAAALPGGAVYQLQEEQPGVLPQPTSAAMPSGAASASGPGLPPYPAGASYDGSTARPSDPHGDYRGSSAYLPAAPNGNASGGQGQAGPGQLDGTSRNITQPGAAFPPADQRYSGQAAPAGFAGAQPAGYPGAASGGYLNGSSGTYQNAAMPNGANAAQAGSADIRPAQSGVAQNATGHVNPVPQTGAGLNVGTGYQPGQNGVGQIGYAAGQPGQGANGAAQVQPGAYPGQLGRPQNSIGPVGYQAGQSGGSQSSAVQSVFQPGVPQSDPRARDPYGPGVASPQLHGGQDPAAQAQYAFPAPDLNYAPGPPSSPALDQSQRASFGQNPAGQYPAAGVASQQYQMPHPASAPLPAVRAQQPVAVALPDAVKAAHAEGFTFGQSVGRDAPGLWLEAVLARKPRMPSDLEARLLQGSVLPIDSLLHDEVRHSLRRGFWDALESVRR